MIKKIMIMGVISLFVTILNMESLQADGEVKGLCSVEAIVMPANSSESEVCESGEITVEDNGKSTFRVWLKCGYGTMKDINQRNNILVSKDADNWEDLYLLLQTAYLDSENSGIWVHLKQGVTEATCTISSEPVWDAAEQVDRIYLVKWVNQN